MKAANDTPVFDVAREAPRFMDALGDWSPPRISRTVGIPVFRYGSDGPSVEHRVKAQEAWITSSRYSGQLSNDNLDWPLGKLLRAENNDHLLRIAERYRDLYHAAKEPTELRGKDLADNIYLMSDIREDESTGARENKGLKQAKGKKARLDMPATRAVVADPDKTKKRGKPIPKQWLGDWPLLHAIDSRRELALAQAALGPLRDSFEAACVGGDTLETIGRDHGVGNKTGAKGGGRALVYLGLEVLDEYWRKPAQRAA